MMARDRLEIRLGGCHLVAGSARPVLDSIQTLSLRFPGQSWWTPPQLRRLGETAWGTTAAFGLPSPDSPAALAELNQELASRAAVLCAVTALDRYHLLNRPEYAEQLDEAMTAAGVLGDDWAPAFDSGLDRLADPVYHLLHVGRRLLRRPATTTARSTAPGRPWPSSRRLAWRATPIPRLACRCRTWRPVPGQGQRPTTSPSPRRS